MNPYKSGGEVVGVVRIVVVVGTSRRYVPAVVGVVRVGRARSPAAAGNVKLPRANNAHPTNHLAFF